MTVALCAPVAAMSDRLDSVRGTLSGADDKGIVQALRDMESLSRQTHAVMLELVAEADSRGIAAGQGFASTQRLLAGMLRLSAADTRTRVEHAAMVGTRRTITGQTLAPRLPAKVDLLAASWVVAQMYTPTGTVAASFCTTVAFNTWASSWICTVLAHAGPARANTATSATIGTARRDTLTLGMLTSGRLDRRPPPGQAPSRRRSAPAGHPNVIWNSPFSLYATKAHFLLHYRLVT